MPWAYTPKKTQRSRRRRSMSATDPKFVVFRDLKDGYKWRRQI